ncbi:helix-turn-helix domain-containing protein [Gracilimonas halophila]|uniref:Helix-turn-helix domain-containing protein n=1 Tax=Gracilimonas halophila TaxID=1834464 RepID=A0ABW5JIK4_9BACT
MESDAQLLNAVAIVLRKLREERNFSQEYLAAEADLSRSMIDKIERRKRLPSLPVLIKIAGAFGMSASELVKRIEIDLNK